MSLGIGTNTKLHGENIEKSHIKSTWIYVLQEEWKCRVHGAGISFVMELSRSQSFMVWRFRGSRDFYTLIYIELCFGNNVAICQPFFL